MAVEGVIFDVSDTLVRWPSEAVEGVIPAVERLRNLGVQIIAVSNEPRAKVERGLAGAAVRVDHIVTRADVGVAKGSPRWIDRICDDTGLDRNQLLYVGDSQHDMITASHAKVVYVHAGWAAPPGQYGMPAPQPAWVAAVVQHIFRKRRRWFWTVDTKDRNGNRIRQKALIDGNGAGRPALKANLLSAFKGSGDPRVGPMLLADFVMLHLVASLYEEGLHDEAGWWTTYPGRDKTRNTVMGNFLDVAAKLFRRQYQPDLFIRHKATVTSKEAFDAGQLVGALDNQLTTVHLNPTLREKLPGKSVLVVDNFLTRGATTEMARNMLLAGGAADVTAVVIGKYGGTNYHFTAPADLEWNPFTEDCPAGSVFAPALVAGAEDNAALTEFLASYDAMAAESW